MRQSYFTDAYLVFHNIYRYAEEWNGMKSQYFHLLQFMCHVIQYPASSISALCGKLKRKRDARMNWIARNIAIELGIGDRRSARHIVYYRYKHMHLATKGHTFYQIPKKNSIPFIHYPENQWSDLSQCQYPYSIPSYPYWKPSTVYGLSLIFCQNEKWTWNWIIWLGSIAKWKIHLYVKKWCCIDYNRCAGQYQRNDMNIFLLLTIIARWISELFWFLGFLFQCENDLF